MDMCTCAVKKYINIKALLYTEFIIRPVQPTLGFMFYNEENLQCIRDIKTGGDK